MVQSNFFSVQKAGTKISSVGLAYTVPADFRSRPMMETIKKAQKANVPLEDYVTREGGAIEFTDELYNLPEMNKVGKLKQGVYY